MSNKKIVAILIIEILGRPPEHVVEALNSHIDKLSKEKGVSVINKKIHDAKKVEKADNLYTAFGEIETEFDSFLDLVNVVFIYMPSNIEIIEPIEIKMENHELGNVLTAITVKMHRYDEISKKLFMDNKYLYEKLNEIREHINKESQSQQAGGIKPNLSNKVNEKERKSEEGKGKERKAEEVKRKKDKKRKEAS